MTQKPDPKSPRLHKASPEPYPKGPKDPIVRGSMRCNIRDLKGFPGVKDPILRYLGCAK